MNKVSVLLRTHSQRGLQSITFLPATKAINIKHDHQTEPFPAQSGGEGKEEQPQPLHLNTSTW